MKLFIDLFIIFLVGSISGFIIEVVYRRFFSAKKWVNPGFLTGPYQPLYGFGVIILYLISQLDINIYYQLILIAFSLTLIEYLTGLIFIKVLNIKLWDYSDTKFNIQGIITPLFSVFWLILGALYMYLINPLIIDLLINVNESNALLIFSLGGVFVLITIDFLNSINFARNLRKVLKKTKSFLHYERFKAYNKLKDKKWFPIKNINTYKENILEFLDKFKKKEKNE